MEALELFRAGKLNEAIEACNREVQKQPARADHRDLLSQLLCFKGDFERADKHLDVLGKQFADREPIVALIRQLIRAAQARQQFFDSGRLPEFLGQPAGYIQDLLKASICLRQGDVAEAVPLLAAADEARPKLSGKCNGVAFENFRDADDLLAPLLEVFTTTGKYYWLPLESVRRLALHAVESPLDVLWRRCQIQAAGEDLGGIVYLPQLYATSATAADEQLCVGKCTDWLGEEHGIVQGIGHRVFWVGEETLPMVRIESLQFDANGEPEKPA